MADVFLSYPRTERARAEDVVAALRASGYDVWWDDDILSSEGWTAAIEREVHIARAVVVLWTRRAVSSEPVLDEAFFALKHGTLVSVRLEDCELGLNFARQQYADLINWNGEPDHREWRRVLKSIEKLVGRAPVAEAAVALHAHGRHHRTSLEMTWLALQNDTDLIRLRAFQKEAEASPFRHAVAQRIEQVERELARRTGAVFSDLPELPSLIVVPAGEFEMGSPETEPGRDESEGPLTPVLLDAPFAIARFPVTRREWSAFARQSGAGDKSPDDPRATAQHPVVNVSWSDAGAYCRWASEVSGHTYRLPTEAEWEYACRAGSRTAYFMGATISTRQANFKPTPGGGDTFERGRTTPVGLFPANSFGLHDMHGLVWEWCADLWRSAYGGANVTMAAGRRTLRGGSWFCLAESVRSAARSSSDLNVRANDVGFRVVRVL